MTNHGGLLSQPVTLSKALARGLDLYPDEVALVTADGRWTWRELDDLSEAYARNLLGLGLVVGDRVASLLPNCGGLFIHYLGAIKAGLVAVPLNYRYTSFEIDHALDISGARALVHEVERQDDVAGAKATAALQWRIVHGEGGRPNEAVDFADLLVPGAGRAALPEASEDTASIIFFTSGSTGPAKGVTHTHRSLGWVFASAARSYQLAPDDRVMAASSCSHVGGYLNVFAAWSEGARHWCLGSAIFWVSWR
ncbi:MAG: class I adenylate-forming enzyme family protein [Pseudomonadota bacterium]